MRALAAEALLVVLAAATAADSSAPAKPVWEPLAPGIDMTHIVPKGATTPVAGRIMVVRVDPKTWEPVLIGKSATGEAEGKTARQWAERHGLAIATNAGMFATDYRTHVGLMRCGDHVNNGRTHAEYKSVAAFRPRDPAKHPPFRIFDLDAPGVAIDTIRHDYACAIQNLRLIKRPGANPWSQQPKRWSEAALGEDAQGRILFIFSRSPLTMHDLNAALLSSGIGIVAAQHLEGGPEAQIYLDVGATKLEMVGSFETGFKESDDNKAAWPIPNVFGVKKR